MEWKGDGKCDDLYTVGRELEVSDHPFYSIP